MKVSLLQVGARHGYAMPRFLASAGALQRLYTDVAFGDGGLAAALLQRLPDGAIAGKLRRRVARGVPSALIDNAPPRRRDDRIGSPPPWHLRDEDIARSDIFYAHYFSGLNGLRPRLRADQRIVSDVMTIPATHHIVNAEAARFPAWEEPSFDADATRAYDRFTSHMLEQSDAFFCPARSVVEGIAAYGEQYRAKCWIVPYGASLRPIADVAPQPKRVLFAGTLTLRKGIQYLRAAADRLRRADPAVRIVVAGGGSAVAMRQMTGENIELLGHLSREAMAREFSIADIFAFPTLAEGSAGVVLEAMAAGLPVVMTAAAGVDLRHPGAALIIPERDADALAEAILRVVNDRPLRAHMSDAARRNAVGYGDNEWAETYLGALTRVAQGSAPDAAPKHARAVA